MELTTHKLRISQSTVNTILSRAQGHYKSILLSAGADEMIFKTKNLNVPGARVWIVSPIPTSLGKATVSAVTAVTTAESIF